jgi:selenocysteine lyase/cysteine desulfurase
VPTISFTVKDITSGIIAEKLGKENIFVWNGDMYAIEAVKALEIHESSGVVRVGAVHYNTIEEIDNFLNTLEKILVSSPKLH